MCTVSYTHLDVYKRQVDARVCGRETLCGSLCYVGCDFVIVNICLHRKPVSMYVPIHMIRFLALDQ